MFASSAILHLTHNDLYGRGVDSTLTKLGLRTTVHFGDRQNRSLIPLDEFARADSCCLQECAFTIGIVGLRRQWAPYERASNERDQDIAVVNVLWNAPFARETPWCNEFIGKMFGIGDSRIARLRAVVTATSYAATSYALKLPCYTAVQALLGGRGQPRLVDSPVEPVTCAPDACLRYAFETYAASFGGNSSTSMDKRLTIGHLFEHLASSTPGLFALSSEGIGRIIELEFKQDYADEFKRRLTISANGVRPQKPKSAYQLFCAAVRAEMLAGASGDGASAIAGSGAAVESPDGNEEDDEEDVPAPTTRLDRQVQQKWREFKEQQADGGGGKYEIEAAAERRLMRPQTELWLKTYHQQSPLPPPWLPVAASSQSQAPKIRAKAPAAVLPRDATGPAPVPLRVDPIPYMDVEEPQIPDEAPMPDSRRKRKPKSYFGD